jgi:hypothetical protein
MAYFVKSSKGLSLSEAQKTGRLQEFIAQQEALELQSVSTQTFDKAVRAAAKGSQPRDRTSRSRVRGGSTGKKTPSRT